ncbi:TPA: acyltransferase [Serratia rubidaea]|nr:acyltransferase [Serratia rubidaea]
MDIKNEEKYFFGITGLRAIAASLVLIVHSSAMLSFGHSISPLVILTNSGVDIFFIISGFIITYAHWNDFGGGISNIRKFFKKRAIRIYPMYVIFTLITTGILIAIPSLFFSLKYSNSLLLSSLFFIPSQMDNGDVTLILAVAWTLSYEVVFYLIFAIAMIFPRRYGLALICISLALWSILHTVYHGEYISEYFLSTLPLEFLFGVLLCSVFMHSGNGLRVNKPLSYFFVLLSIVSILTIPFHFPYDISELRGNGRFIYFGIPSLILFFALFNTGRPKNPIVSKSIELIGNASYVTYLSHFLTIGVIKFIMKRIEIIQSIPLFIIVIFSCIACTTVGILVHIFVERKVLGFLNSRA